MYYNTHQKPYRPLRLESIAPADGLMRSDPERRDGAAAVCVSKRLDISPLYEAYDRYRANPVWKRKPPPEAPQWKAVPAYYPHQQRRMPALLIARWGTRRTADAMRWLLLGIVPRSHGTYLFEPCLGESVRIEHQFQWLLQGNPPPSHWMINAFRKHLLRKAEEKTFRAYPQTYTRMETRRIRLCCAIPRPVMIVVTIDSPVKTIDLKFETIDLPVKTIDLIVKTIDLKFETIDSPVKTIDLKFETIDSIVKTIDLLVKTIDLIVKTIDLKFKTIDSPVKTIDLKFETIDLLVKTIDLIVKTIDLLVKTIDLKFETIDLIVKTIDLKFEDL
jgi:hypothetical protein